MSELHLRSLALGLVVDLEGRGLVEAEHSRNHIVGEHFTLIVVAVPSHCKLAEKTQPCFQS